MILFVVSNESPLKDSPLEPLKGRSSEWNFKNWARYLTLDSYKTINVYKEYHKEDGSTGFEISMFDLKKKVADSGPAKIVTLGSTASKALELSGVDHFKLPNPSPHLSNSFIKNDVYLYAILEECKKWLSNTIH